MTPDEWWKLIERGENGWNEWRQHNPDVRIDLRGLRLADENLSGYDLRGANLRGASLRGAWLTGCPLENADLREAHLTIAKLQEAVLTGADLRGAQLNNAFLNGATLLDVDLSGAILRGADFSNAIVGRTVFGYTDLRSAANLDQVEVRHPVSIGLDTLQTSRWVVPRVLLAKSGMPPDVIATIEGWAGRAESFQTCFLSHSSKDHEFATKLYDGLRTDGVACWYSAQDIPPGTAWEAELYENLKAAERVLVLVSQNALTSDGVRQEMETVLASKGTSVSRIMPLKLVDDETWRTTTIPWAVALRESVQAVNFLDASRDYEHHYRRLLRALTKSLAKLDDQG